MRFDVDAFYQSVVTKLRAKYSDHPEASKQLDGIIQKNKSIFDTDAKTHKERVAKSFHQERQLLVQETSTGLDSQKLALEVMKHDFEALGRWFAIYKDKLEEAKLLEDKCREKLLNATTELLHQMNLTKDGAVHLDIEHLIDNTSAELETRAIYTKYLTFKSEGLSKEYFQSSNEYGEMLQRFENSIKIYQAKIAANKKHEAELLDECIKRALQKFVDTVLVKCEEIAPGHHKGCKEYQIVIPIDPYAVFINENIEPVARELSVIPEEEASAAPVVVVGEGGASASAGEASLD